MPLDPRLWMVPPLLRRFPEEVTDLYMDEDTPLVEIVELWSWKHNLMSLTHRGLEPDERAMAERLGREVSDFLNFVVDEPQADTKDAEPEQGEEPTAQT